MPGIRLDAPCSCALQCPTNPISIITQLQADNARLLPRQKLNFSSAESRHDQCNANAANKPCANEANSNSAKKISENS
jgi:hypothetical protein